MAKSKAVYFGAIWTEDKDTPTGSMDVEKLRELVEVAEDAGEERIFFSAFDNDDKEGQQPDINLVWYPNEGGRKKSRGSKRGGRSSRGGSKKSSGKKRSYGSSKKSSMF